MTYNIAINQVKAIEWDLSLRACCGMSKFVDLSTWATPVIVESKVYYILYRSKLLEEIPIVGKSLSVASKIIKELEEKEIIESINKSTTPAYRLTDKGLEWVSDTKKEKTKGAEKKDSSKKEKFTFRLKRELEFDDLSREYTDFLKAGCEIYAKENGISQIEYTDFVNQKKSVGKAHKDWASAFKTWCSNAKKFHRGKSTPTKSTNPNHLDNQEL